MKTIFQSPIFLGVVICSVAAAVIYGMILVGSPAEQRQLQFDQRRTSDLQQIASAIQMYWEQQKKLPQGFDDLKQQQFAYIQSVQDPETQMPYEYRVLPAFQGKVLSIPESYVLCAVFATDSSQVEAKTKTLTPFSAEQWNHGKGRTCFTREVQSILR